jgi:Relaxase/Mobilisation nuclease domain
VNIKGKSRAGGRELAKHLLNAEKNETVKVLAVEGTVSRDLHGAFQEMEAVASGTQCKKPLYHAKISPDPKEPALTPEQLDRSIKALTNEFGLEGHAYAVVRHRKYGKAHPNILREHFHVVYCRINPDTMLAAHDGHNYRKHELVARQLEREFGHARIQGAHIEREGVERPPRTPPDWAMQQAVKSGIQPREVADSVKQLWDKAGSARSFTAALEREGLTLALGRRDLVILDQAGDVHTLARCLNVKVADIRERMAEIDRSKLPTVEQAREAIHDRNAKKESPAPVWDRDHANQKWQDAVINAAIEMEKTAPRFATQRPDGGTLAGGDREKEQPRQHAANDNTARAEIRALAAMLQKQKSEERGAPVNDNEAVKERMLAFGFDPKPATVAKWQELGGKVDAGGITEKDRLREMAQYLWLEADKERRAGHKEEQSSSRESQQNEQPARARQREPERER